MLLVLSRIRWIPSLVQQLATISPKTWGSFLNYLNLGQDGQDRCSHTEQHVDADEGFVLSASISVGVVHIEHDHADQ